jgi:hypothetical protein
MVIMVHDEVLGKYKPHERKRKSLFPNIDKEYYDFDEKMNIWMNEERF